MDTIIQFEDGSSRNPNILDDIEDIDTIVIDDGQGGRFHSAEILYDSAELGNTQPGEAYMGLDRSDSRNSIASSVRSVSGALTGRRKANTNGNGSGRNSGDREYPPPS